MIPTVNKQEGCAESGVEAILCYSYGHTWLTQLRILHSSANESRPQIRAYYKGYVQRRLQESLDDARQFATELGYMSV